jgi:hypothetical protein
MVTKVTVHGVKLKFEVTHDTAKKRQWVLKISLPHTQVTSLYSTESEAVDALFQVLKKILAFFHMEVTDETSPRKRK